MAGILGFQYTPGDDDWIDAGTLSRRREKPRVIEGLMELTIEERETLLDLTQLVLDLVGIIEPTPFADGTNAVISLKRNDWLGAGLSGLSLIPYIGDLAKVGKLGRWAQTVDKAVRMAAKNPAFAARAWPVLGKIIDILEQVPVSALPSAAQAGLRRIKEKLLSMPGLSRKVVRADLVKRYLAKWQSEIDRMVFNLPPGSENPIPILWARLDGSVDEAADIAKNLKPGKGSTEPVKGFTINQVLPEGFSDKIDIAKAQLAEILGEAVPYAEFEREVWRRVSMKYTELLEGRVTAYVRFNTVRKGFDGKVSDQGINAMSGRKFADDPVLFDELERIAAVMNLNPRITSVKLLDPVTGESKNLMRSEVLQSSKHWN